MLAQLFQFPESLSHFNDTELSIFLLNPSVSSEKILEYIKTDRTLFPRISRFAPSVLIKLVGQKPEFFIPAVESDLATFGRIVDKLPDWAVIQLSIRVPDLWVAVANADVSYLVRLAQRRILFIQLITMGSRYEINLDFLIVCLIDMRFFKLVINMPDFAMILRECSVIYWELFIQIEFEQQTKHMSLIPLLKICSHDKPSRDAFVPPVDKSTTTEIEMLNKKVEELMKIINATSKITEEKPIDSLAREEKPIDTLVRAEEEPIDTLVRAEEKPIDTLVREEKLVSEEKSVDELTKLQSRVNDMDSKMDMILELLSKK
jgi:hypothetical protein